MNKYSRGLKNDAILPIAESLIMWKLIPDIELIYEI